MPSFGFTLAEVLITLGIIGVVAALTMPALIANHQKTVVVTKLKKVYSVMNQAVTMSIANDTWTQPPTDKREDNVALAEWLNSALVPYLNGAKLYDNNPNQQYSPVNFNSRPTIILADGSALTFNNNNLIHVYYDINGRQGPNRGGRDWFRFFLDYNLKSNTKAMGYFYPSGYAYSNSGNEEEEFKDIYVYNDRDKMIKYCGEYVKNYLNGISNTCALLIMYDGWQIKDDYPW